MNNHDVLLEVKNLEISYAKNHWWSDKLKTERAVNKVSLTLHAGETLGLLGESGCGKSSLARAIVGLVPATSGQLFYRGLDYTSLQPQMMRPLRAKIQMIFQDPSGSLNPRQSVRTLLDRPLALHQPGLNSRERRFACITMLERVGLHEGALERFPHDFSGGQRQRLAIARALLLKPELIVCDEVVSALDVSVQSQVLNLLLELQEDFGLSYLFISHDISVVRHISDRIVIMQKGSLVEECQASDILLRHQHTYTRTLIHAAPSLDLLVASPSHSFPSTPSRHQEITRCHAALV
jgi:ABC-type glutathione transport system ATPase component